MSYIAGVTLLATTDNLLFPFSTEILMQFPMNLFLNKSIGFTMFDGMNVIKVNIPSLTIQNFMLLLTGFQLSPLCYYQENKEQPQNTVNSLESTTDDMLLDDDISQLMTEFIEENNINEYSNKQSTCNQDKIIEMLDNDEQFAEFDNFVSTHFTF